MVYKQFLEFLNDDINTPRALSYMWEILRENRLNDSEKHDIILKFDKVFGLDLNKVREIKVSKELEKLILERDMLREKKDWKKADEIRKKINKLGFVIEDTKERVVIKKR
jgi:cysteinyl-tRNA synthetase